MFHLRPVEDLTPSWVGWAGAGCKKHRTGEDSLGLKQNRSVENGLIYEIAQAKTVLVLKRHRTGEDTFGSKRHRVVKDSLDVKLCPASDENRLTVLRASTPGRAYKSYRRAPRR
ncbi:hypothetical protein AVEN_143225-1 [Araneus ventricosus]|uniref:Uncharacterized protein n=1 Tax=Araneus ventricosus TaxID=182803 RepID=A0A4Y2AEY7_ARAVE|nr:hypothetical protein AVEN_143225-1 [Araneus ventricosus]